MLDGIRQYTRRAARLPGAAFACPACRSSDVAPAFHVRDFLFVRCRRCASLFVEDRTVPMGVSEELYRGSAYFRNTQFTAAATGGYHGYQDYLADRSQIETKFSSILERVESEIPVGRLLDVGAGPGFLLAVAGARGWDAVGLDPNEWAVAYAREELGVDVRPGRLPNTGLAGDSFDALTLMDVIEHLPDPDPVLEEAGRLLREGGVLSVLTPDAGSATSRFLGRRWPEAIRVPEHLVLYSARGLGALLRRHGFDVIGWHSVGKRSNLGTLLADISPVAPAVGHLALRAAEHAGIADRSVELDPRTKLVLYARKALPASASVRRETRLRKRATAITVEEAIVEDLAVLARASHLSQWMFDQFRTPAGGRVLEIGAGIGTFSGLLLQDGVEELVLVEPEDRSAAELERRFARDAAVRIVREPLPDSPTLAQMGGSFDLVVCQNVLEHIPDDLAAVSAMARALKPGGSLFLLVPAEPWLYGRLDEMYGHERRYTRERLRRLICESHLELECLHAFNLPGIVAWWLASRRSHGRIAPWPLLLYDRLIPIWRRVEPRIGPPAGLSLVVLARRP